MKRAIAFVAIALVLGVIAVISATTEGRRPNASIDSVDAPGVAVSDPESTIVSSQTVLFTNDGIEFVGKLTYPTNLEAHAVAVFVHGSEQFSAIENFLFADGFARRGVATLVFDKRGTGSSGGTFTFVLDTLASDVSAAIESISDQPAVANLPVGLVAISQGGWVAPIVALESNDVSFLVLDSGSALSQQETDRWVTEQWLVRQGVAAADVTEARHLMNAVYDTLACSFRCRWDELESAKQDAADQSWYDLLGQAPTNVGFVLGAQQPQLVAMFESMGGRETNEEFRQDPLLILEQVDMPSLWLLGNRDELVPAARSASLLEALSADTGVPVNVVTLPGEDHSIISRAAAEDNWQLIDQVFAFILSESR